MATLSHFSLPTPLLHPNTRQFSGRVHCVPMNSTEVGQDPVGVETLYSPPPPPPLPPDTRSHLPVTYVNTISTPSVYFHKEPTATHFNLASVVRLQ